LAAGLLTRSGGYHHFTAASDRGYSAALRALLNEFSMAQFWSQVGRFTEPPAGD
jgi:hypothetical protein